MHLIPPVRPTAHPPGHRPEVHRRLHDVEVIRNVQRRGVHGLREDVVEPVPGQRVDHLLQPPLQVIRQYLLLVVEPRLEPQPGASLELTPQFQPLQVPAVEGNEGVTVDAHLVPDVERGLVLVREVRAAELGLHPHALRGTAAHDLVQRSASQPSGIAAVRS